MKTTYERDPFKWGSVVVIGRKTQRQQMAGCRPQSDSALWGTYGALWFLVQKQSEFFILNYLPAMQETQL